MKKKLAAIAMATAMAASLAACSSKPAETTAAAEENEETTAEAAEGSEAAEAGDSAFAGKTLVMSTNAEFAPYEYHDGNDIVGIDVDIANAICEDMGASLEITDVAFDSIIPEVQSGKADFAAAGMTVTEDRQTQVDFSDTYAIGVQQGTTGDLYSTDDFGEESVQRFSKGADAVQALSTGKIDAVIIDNKPAQVFVDENEGLKLLETPYAEEEYAIAVKKGNTELLDAINASIANLKESGKLDEIVEKYITAE